MYCYRTFISVFESSIFDIGEHCIARTASVLKYFIPVSRQNSSTPVIIFEALLQEVVLSSWDNMFPGTKFRCRRDPQKSSSYIYRWKCTLTPAVIKIYPGGCWTWWRLAKMKNKRNRSVRRQMCKRSWKLTLEAQNQQRPKRWGILNCKSGFTHCSRDLWGQASSTIMLSLGWLSCSL